MLCMCYIHVICKNVCSHSCAEWNENSLFPREVKLCAVTVIPRPISAREIVKAAHYTTHVFAPAAVRRMVKNLSLSVDVASFP